MTQNRYDAYLAVAAEHRALLDRHIDAIEPEDGFNQRYYDTLGRLRRTQQALDEMALAVGVLKALCEESWGFWWLRDEGLTPMLTIDSTIDLDPEQYAFLQTLTEDPT